MKADSTSAPERATTLSTKEAWDAAFAAWEAAKAAYDAAAKLHDDDFAAAKAQGRPFDDDLAKQCDDAGTVESNARFALIQTPAPDFRALLHKTKLLWAREDATGEREEHTEGWHRKYPDAVIADMVRLQAEYAEAWLAPWERDGGVALVCPDGKLHLSFPTYELSPRYVAPADHMDERFAQDFISTNAQHYHSTMNARVDALKAVPGGVDMVKAHIAAKRSIWA
ncbi:hypothetical protein [Sphingopyxis sp. Geo48]|uniref:hypothetical protein n=1 Tax=Sphingopyxis sp. Geo48 TaxID=545241 RepID=UPI0024B7034A|nr:hypothetical protein [Sphingopyxis sp. Geo48]